MAGAHGKLEEPTSMTCTLDIRAVVTSERARHGKLKNNK